MNYDTNLICICCTLVTTGSSITAVDYYNYYYNNNITTCTLHYIVTSAFLFDFCPTTEISRLCAATVSCHDERIDFSTTTIYRVSSVDGLRRSSADHQIATMNSRMLLIVSALFSATASAEWTNGKVQKNYNIYSRVKRLGIIISYLKKKKNIFLTISM